MTILYLLDLCGFEWTVVVMVIEGVYMVTKILLPMDVQVETIFYEKRIKIGISQMLLRKSLFIRSCLLIIPIIRSMEFVTALKSWKALNGQETTRH